MWNFSRGDGWTSSGGWTSHCTVHLVWGHWRPPAVVVLYSSCPPSLPQICLGGPEQCLFSRSWLAESGLLCLGLASQTPQEKSVAAVPWGASNTDGPPVNLMSSLFSWTLGSPYWGICQHRDWDWEPGQANLVSHPSSLLRQPKFV